MPRITAHLIATCLALSLTLPAARAQSADEGYVDAALDRVDSLRGAKQTALAWGTLETLRDVAPAMNRHQRGRYLKLVGNRAFGRRDYAGAKEAYWRARAAFAQSGRADAGLNVANTYTSVGIMLYREGRYAAATDTLAAGIAFAKTLPDSAARAVLPAMYTTVAGLSERTEDFGTALRYARESLDLLAELGRADTRSAAVAHLTVGNTLRRMGRYRESSAAYAAAADILRTLYGERNADYQSAIGNEALNARSLGEVDRAIAIFQKKLALLLDAPEVDQVVLTNTYLNLGSAYAESSNLAQAEEALTVALSVWRANNDGAPQLKELNILRNLAEVYLAQGKTEEAGKLLTGADRTERALGLGVNVEVIALREIRGAYLLAVDSVEAGIAAYRSAYELASRKRGGFGNEVSSAFGSYVAVLLEHDRLPAARAVLDSAATALERERGALGEGLSFQGDVALTVLNVQYALLSAPGEPVEPALTERLVALDRAYRARVARLRGRVNQRYLATLRFGPSALMRTLAEVELRSAMTQTSAQQAQPYLARAVGYIGDELRYISVHSELARDARLSADDQRLARRLSDQAAAFEALLAGETTSAMRDREVSAAYRDSLIAVEERIHALLDSTGGEQRAVRTPGAPATLNPDRRALVLFGGLRRAYAVTCVGGAYAVEDLGDVGAYRDDTRAYKALLRDPTRGFGESRLPLEAGARLYDRTLRRTGLDAQAATGPLHVLSTALLDQLPLAALPNGIDGAKTFRGLDFAVAHTAFTYHGSLRSLRGDQPTPGRRLRPRVLAVAPMDDAQTRDTTRTARWAALPGAQLATDYLRDAFEADVLRGVEATQERLFAESAQHDIVHLATHARSEPRDGRYSYVLLADTSAADGLRPVYANTISEHDLDTRLVVLSACETGEGSARPGEGSVSLASVLVEAGASATLNTLWRVDDRQSAALTRGFYAAMREGEALDEALANAQRRYLAEAGSQYTHPYYWAGFTLLGDPSPVVRSWRRLGTWAFVVLALAGLAAVAYRASLRRHAA